MLVADLDYSDYLGRLAVGKVFHGTVRRNEDLVCLDKEGKAIPLRISKLQVYDGINLKAVDSAQPGDLIILAGIEDVEIGDTICTREAPKVLPRISVDEPTISMLFTSNTSPLSGKEGKYVQSGKIRERLYRESLRNVAIRVEDAEEADRFIVKGRGEFQMAILIETMRREGFEISVGRPQVIYKHRGGDILEPIEHLFIDCDENFIGTVSEKLSQRKGRMVNLVNHGRGRLRMEFTIPSRSLIGYRHEFLTDTKGTGIMNSYLQGYEEYRGEFPLRLTGSLISDRQGESVSYALFNLEPRGTLFLKPGEPVYEGMIIGEHNRENDINVNPCKMKKLTNMRTSTRDDSIQLTPVTPLTLERAIEFIKDDEMVEVTPRSIRLRKTILSADHRHRLRADRLNG
jgi:GTP-binding protein